jgi:hypothetical protein
MQGENWQGKGTAGPRAVSKDLISLGTWALGSCFFDEIFGVFL